MSNEIVTLARHQDMESNILCDNRIFLFRMAAWLGATLIIVLILIGPLVQVQTEISCYLRWYEFNRHAIVLLSLSVLRYTQISLSSLYKKFSCKTDNHTSISYSKHVSLAGNFKCISSLLSLVASSMLARCAFMFSFTSTYTIG